MASQGEMTGKKKTKAQRQGQAKPKKEPRPKKEKPARTTPAHMSKVDKVASQLPVLSEDATAVFTVASNMSTADMNSLVAHLQIAVRRRGVTAVAQGRTGPVAPGTRVRIKSGSGGVARFIGQMGTVSKVQRIRCFVRIDGRNKDDYFFIADVDPLASAGSGSVAETIARLTAQPTPVDISTIEDEPEETAATDGAAATG